MVENITETTEETQEIKKTSYVMPVEFVDAIRNEAPELFQEAVLVVNDYSMGRNINPRQLSPAARVLFNVFKRIIDDNTRRYEERVKRNQENGKKNKGGKRTQKNPE